MQAAHELFAEQGMSTTVDQVAARAGVGRATVYRSFPTRSSLVEAMSAERIDWMLARLRRALAAPDITTEFPVFVHEVMLRVLGDRVLGEVVAPPLEPGANREWEIGELMAALVARGHAAGCINEEISHTDLGLLLSGLVLALVHRCDIDPDSWHRAADLVVMACGESELRP